jgi:hypothetical protein
MATSNETQDNVLSCHECGASVYKEHLDKGLAGFYAGKLLCVYCLKAKKGPAPRPLEEKAAPVAAGPQAAPAAADELPPIALVDELEPPEPPAQKTSHGTAVGTVPPASADDGTRYTRPLNKTGAGATRCRTFHAKLSDEAVAHMDRLINEWCEQHPDVEVKFSTSTVGMWTGKHSEPNLIVTVFY